MVGIYRTQEAIEAEWAALGSEQYDASRYAYCYEECFWGGGWVTTSNVEGLAYFGPLKTNRLWYGAAPAWMQPFGGGVPTKVEQAITNGPVYGNGGKTEGPEYHSSSDSTRRSWSNARPGHGRETTPGSTRSPSPAL